MSDSAARAGFGRVADVRRAWACTANVLLPRRSSAASTTTRTVTSHERTHLLEVVAGASLAFEAARLGLHDAVRAALDDGATWSDIGDVLGVSRQAAFQRFGPKRTQGASVTTDMEQKVNRSTENGAK